MFGVVTNDQPWLKRTIETYQWNESSTVENQVTKYAYTSVWQEAFIDSSGFRQKGYNNTKCP
jgi:hypothetical protein